jgi:predicted AAA+ superfamily ATPase
LAARLLGATQASLLGGSGQTRREDNMLGSLFESLAVLTLRVLAQSNGARVSHLRTRNGDHEIDMIVERDDHKVLAIEVKLASAATAVDAKHLNWLELEIGDSLIDKIILNTGEYAYRDCEGTAIVPLGLLGP